MTDPTFDPTTVPAFPVLTLTMDGEQLVTLNGLPVDVPEGSTPSEAGVAAAAAHASELGLDAVRVRALVDGLEHRMAVTAAGDAHELAMPVIEAQKRRSRAPFVVALSLAGVIVVGGTVAALAVVLPPSPQPTATVDPGPPGANANIPVVVPPGFAERATWSLPVGAQTEPRLIDDERLLITDDRGELNLVDAETGAVTWRGSQAPRGTTVVHLSEVEGRSVLAAGTDGTLSLWPLDSDQAPVAPVQVSVGRDAEISYLGSRPLITLPNQTVGMFTADDLSLRDVPVTATPILSGRHGIVAANEESWWLISADATPVRSALPRPEGTTGPPLLLSAADDDTLIVVWPQGAAAAVTLVDLQSNSITATGVVRSRAVAARDLPVHAADADTLTLGEVFIDFSAAPRIVEIPDVTPFTVSGSTVYGTTDNEAVVIDTSEQTPSPEPFTTMSNVDTEPPIAALNTTVYVVSEKVDETLVYASALTEGEAP
jgi:hypothetical protein